LETNSPSLQPTQGGSFFGGVFATVIPDNMKTVVEKADP
jgi:hypothetical protein